MTSEKKSLDFCSVPNCSNYRNEDISLHRFPKDLELRKLWLQAVKLKTFNPSYRICNNHFLPDDFHLPGVTTMRRRLRLNTVPSRNLPSVYKNQKTFCKPLILRRKACKRKKDLEKSESIIVESQALDATEPDLKDPDQLDDSSCQSSPNQQSDIFIKVIEHEIII